MHSRIAELAQHQQFIIIGEVTYATAGVCIEISVYSAAAIARRVASLVALGDGDDALGREAAGDGRAGDGAEAGLAEGAARLDARPRHDADEAEVVGAAVELPAHRPPRVRQADAAAHALLLLLPCRRRRRRGVAGGRRGHGGRVAAAAPRGRG